MEALLNVKEASALTRLSPKTLYGYAEKRIIPHVKLGRRLFFSKERLEAWIGSHEVESLKRGEGAK